MKGIISVLKMEKFFENPKMDIFGKKKCPILKN
jgi:hypothetical protein